MRESEIQAKIITALKANGWLVVKMIQTTMNGWPDLQAHKDGVTLFVEVKQPGEKPRPLQEYVHEQLRKQGFKVIVATDIKDIYDHTR